MYFRYYGARKTWLDQCLKCGVSRDPSESTMVNEPIIVDISMAAPSPYLLTTVNTIDLRKVSISDMQNLKTVS